MTYLSDTILLLRFFEAEGRIRRAVSVIKKRTGRHEDTIREYRIDRGGIRVGAPLHDFRGVLTGVPSFGGRAETLLSERQSDAGRRPRAGPILAPGGRDGQVAAAILAEVGIGATVCADLDQLVAALDAGAAIVAERPALGPT